MWHTETPSPIEHWREFMYGGRSYIEMIWQCLDCNFSCVDNPTSGEDYYKEAAEEVYTALSEARARYFNQVKLGLLKRIGRSLGEGARILDLGAGTGEWLDAWSDKYEKYATEAHPIYIDGLRIKGIKVQTGLDQIGGELDMISAFDFVEHVHDPAEFISQIYSKLAPGGIAVFGVPDMGKVLARLFGTRYYLYCPMHYSYFTQKSFSMLLQRQFLAKPIVYSSPPMYTNIRSVAKWIAPWLENKSLGNIWLPFGYKASLIGVVQKSTYGNVR